jgi:hypothetical protein
MRKALVRLFLLVVAVFGFSTASRATPITFTISGTASGQLDSSPFTNALVTVTSTADTTNVVGNTADFDGNGSTETIYAVPSSLTRITIAGLGTVDVIDATAIYSFPGFTVVDPGEELLLEPAVIIGTLDSPPSLDSFTGVAAIGASALSGYNLATSLGSIVGDGGVGHPPIPISTSGGNLTFASNDLEGRTGTFAAAVPEPASAWLLISGVLSCVASGRFRRRQLGRQRF